MIKDINKIKRPSEKIAALILDAYFSKDIIIIPTDDGRQASAYDFEISQAGKVISAIDVTESCIENERERTKALESYKYKVVNIGNVKKTWVIKSNGVFENLKKLLTEIHIDLEKLEYRNINSFQADPDNPNHVISRLYKKYGEIRGNCQNATPNIFIIPAKSGSWVDPEQLNTLVKNEISKGDNIKKFKLSTALQKEIFILIDYNTIPNCLDIWDSETSALPPQFPAEITGVWITLRSPYKELEYKIWKVSPIGWKDLGIIQICKEGLNENYQ